MNDLKKTIKKLLLTTSVVMTFSTGAHSTIVYTDIVDETLTPTGTIEIDMDGAGGSEFSISDMGFGGNTIPSCWFNGTNYGFVTVSPAEWDVMKGLAVGATIDANAGFYNNGVDANVDPGWNITPFPSGQDTYIGAQFDLGATNHFGWIRVNWDGAGTFIVKDFAYENVADQEIIAGDGIAILLTSMTISGEGGLNSITSSNGSLQMMKNVLPINATDQSVTWAVNNQSGAATISVTGLLTAVSDGIVEVVATANDGSAVTASLSVTISNQTASLMDQSGLYFKVFPNPALNNIVIQGEVGAIITIRDLKGELLKEFELEFLNQSVDISNLSAGVYMLTSGLESIKLFKH